MKLKPIHRILLTTDGSITAIIEAVTEKKVEVETVEQKVIKADSRVAKLLDVQEGSDVNYRVVYLKADGEVYAKAISFTPLCRLENSFKNDLMRADIPIGKIMRKHNIEARREIRWKKVIEADDELARELGVKVGSTVLVRNYDIIRHGKVLINITEYFPADKFH